MELSSRPAEISVENWSLLSRIYRSPNDIDLYTAGLAEEHAEGKRRQLTYVPYIVLKGCVIPRARSTLPFKTISGT